MADTTYGRLEQLSTRERSAMLRKFDELVPKIASRSASEVRGEPADIRKAKKSRRTTNTFQPRMTVLDT